MSLESAKAFIDRMKKDEDFRKKVLDYKDAESRKAFVLKEGFDFNLQELKSSANELSENDLAAVSAGGCYFDGCIVHGSLAQ